MSERPRIWIPERRIEAPHLVLSRTGEGELVSPPAGMSGHFELELIHARTGEVTRRLAFRNLITNGGMNLFFTVTAVYQQLAYCAVGTGNTPPAFTDATLAAEAGRTNANGGTNDTEAYSAGPPEYWEFIRTRLFSEAQGNGNLTEIGMVTASSGGTLFNRQLLLDQNGEPTVLVKTNQEQLRVTFRLRCHIPPADVTGTVTLSGLGTTHDYTIRPIRTTFGSQLGWGSMTYYGPALDDAYAARAHDSNVLVSRTATSPQGTGVASNAGVAAAYTAGSFQREYTYSWEPGYANFAGGVGSIHDFSATSYDASRSIYQIAFTQKIAKTDTRRLKLTMRRSIARV